MSTNLKRSIEEGSGPEDEVVFKYLRLLYQYASASDSTSTFRKFKMRPTTLSLVALGAALSSCVSVVPLDHEARALKDRSVGEAVVEIQGDHRHSTKPVPGPTSSTSTTSASSTSTFAPTISTSLSAVSSNVIKTRSVDCPCSSYTD